MSILQNNDALLQGASVSDILILQYTMEMQQQFKCLTIHNQKGSLTFPTLKMQLTITKHQLPYVALHDLNEDGGTVTLSSTSNANTTIVMMMESRSSILQISQNIS